MIERPGSDEYAEFYAGYIARLPQGDVLELLAGQKEQIAALAATVSAERETFRYAPGKWSVRELVGHVGDAERIFGYRALRFSRGDEAPLPGFEENAYVASSGFDARPLGSLLAELTALREANLLMFQGLAPEAWLRRGVANTHPISVRALAFILAGHFHHHLGVLRERYGIAVGEPAAARR
jgi:hypothetical protein